MREEKVLGFDYRDVGMTIGQAWDASRRECFLLNGEASVPLSVDGRVWPTVLDSESAHYPDYTGMNGSLWESLYDLREWVGSHGLIIPFHSSSPEPDPRIQTSRLRNTGAPALEIAVTWLSDTGFPERPSFGPFLHDHIVPAEVNPEWQFLGYDVADFMHYSGLMNCGYSPEELTELRPTWRDRLNRHHLFDDPASALAFRDITDERVKEHAPFEVMGLYAIRRITPAAAVRNLSMML